MNIFFSAKHTMHHSDGLLNRIWSGVINDTTYLRYGCGVNSTVDPTIKVQPVKEWQKVTMLQLSL